jgi:hypothetical protein
LILIDANILLYAYDATSERQAQARDWLEETLSGPEAVGLPWSVLLAFLRLGTSLTVYQRPLTTKEAVEIVARWLEALGVVVLEPTERHWLILRSLLSKAQVRGPAVTDAHLAALALEHGATLCTTDRGFARFPGLKLLDPLEAR